MTKPYLRAPLVRLGEVPTPERRRQNGGVISEVAYRDRSGNALLLRYRGRVECMLDAYRMFGTIDKGQYKAGMKFRRAYVRTIIGVRLSETRGRTMAELPFEAANHNDRLLTQAYSALSPKQKALTIHVCGHDKCAADEHQVSLFQSAMNILAEFWGFA